MDSKGDSFVVPSRILYIPVHVLCVVGGFLKTESDTGDSSAVGEKINDCAYIVFHGVQIVKEKLNI